MGSRVGFRRSSSDSPGSVGRDSDHFLLGGANGKNKCRWRRESLMFLYRSKAITRMTFIITSPYCLGQYYYYAFSCNTLHSTSPHHRLCALGYRTQERYRVERRYSVYRERVYRSSFNDTYMVFATESAPLHKSHIGQHLISSLEFCNSIQLPRHCRLGTVAMRRRDLVSAAFFGSVLLVRVYFIVSISSSSPSLRTRSILETIF